MDLQIKVPDRLYDWSAAFWPSPPLLCWMLISVRLLIHKIFFCSAMSKHMLPMHFQHWTFEGFPLFQLQIQQIKEGNSISALELHMFVVTQNRWCIKETTVIKIYFIHNKQKDFPTHALLIQSSQPYIPSIHTWRNSLPSFTSVERNLN